MRDEKPMSKRMALRFLDAALCQFLNNADDEFDPRYWVPSVKRDFSVLCDAYNEAHKAGVFPQWDWPRPPKEEAMLQVAWAKHPFPPDVQALFDAAYRKRGAKDA